MLDPLAERLRQLGVSTLHEVSERGGLVTGLRLLVGEPFAGPAVTVELPAGDNLGIHLALEAAEPGSVVCVASAGRGKYGVFGDLLFEAARQRAVAGILIDDGIRDIDNLVAPPSVAARGAVARGTVKARVRQPVGSPVPVGGTLVLPGDWIVCDSDGICVIPAAAAEATVSRAETRVKKEDGIRELLIHGTTSREALQLFDKSAGSLC